MKDFLSETRDRAGERITSGLEVAQTYAQRLKEATNSRWRALAMAGAGTVIAGVGFPSIDRALNADSMILTTVASLAAATGVAGLTYGATRFAESFRR